VLELGTGTGETAQRVLARHPAAVLVGLDAGREILDYARARLPADRVELRVARLEDALPDGRFDVVVSALAVHDLDGAGGGAVRARCRQPHTRRTGRPRRFRRARGPCELVTTLEPGYDTPSSIAEQLQRLTTADLQGARRVGTPRSTGIQPTVRSSFGMWRSAPHDLTWSAPGDDALNESQRAKVVDAFPALRQQTGGCEELLDSVWGAGSGSSTESDRER
jgi:Methyltransferase domain